MIERKLFGGTCVNTGCIPTKTLIASAHAAHMARRGGDFGVLVGGAVAVDMKKVKARKDEVSGDFAPRRRICGSTAWSAARCSAATPASKAHARSASTAKPSKPSASSSISAAAPSCPTCLASTRSSYLTNTTILDLDTLAAASGDRRRQLYRARIRADVPPLRRRGDGDRTRRRA